MNPFSRRWLFTTFLVLAGTALCVRLGVWQLDRLSQRRAFNTHVLQMRALPAFDLNAGPASSLEGQEYRAVTVTGVYDFEHQVALRNQVWMDPLTGETKGGYHLLTPLVPVGGGTAILVDRGWIPAAGNDSPADWRRYDARGEQILSGIIRLGQTEPGLFGQGDPPLAAGETRRDFWFLANLERIGQQLPYPLMGVYIQLDPVASRTAPPVPFQPELELTEGPHMGYALQWFAFASILFFGYPFYLRRQEAK
jgi:surfeit locus 1 family protein